MLWVKISLLIAFWLFSLKSTNADAEVTVCGAKCATQCTQGSTYRWCGVWSNSKYSKWDYCSRPGQAISGERCVSSCQKKDRTSYYWCKTADSWNYCSPSRGSGHSTNCTGTSGWTIFGVLCGIVIAIVCCVYLKPVFRSCCCSDS